MFKIDEIYSAGESWILWAYPQLLRTHPHQSIFSNFVDFVAWLAGISLHGCERLWWLVYDKQDSSWRTLPSKGMDRNLVHWCAILGAKKSVSGFTNLLPFELFIKCPFSNKKKLLKSVALTKFGELHMNPGLSHRAQVHLREPMIQDDPHLFQITVGFRLWNMCYASTQGWCCQSHEIITLKRLTYHLVR